MRKDLLSSALDSLRANIAIIDYSGKICAVNKPWMRFARINGLPKKYRTFVGEDYLKILKKASKQSIEAKMTLKGIRQVMTKKSSNFEYEYECSTPVKNLFFLLQVTKSTDKNHIVVAHIDITERKVREMEKDSFIAFASHEIKTPLSSAIIYSQLLERKLSSNQQMAQISRQLNRIRRLVDSMMDVAKIHAGQLKIELNKINLSNLIEDAIEEIQPMLGNRKIKYRKRTDLILKADFDRIFQVVSNLLSNAVKYSKDESTITIKTSKKNNLTYVSVIDNGIGISTVHHSKIFQNMYRASRKNVQKSLGIGLYISKQIIDAHNGQIWVESKKGKGSTFIFTLPAKK